MAIIKEQTLTQLQNTLTGVIHRIRDIGLQLDFHVKSNVGLEWLELIRFVESNTAICKRELDTLVPRMLLDARPTINGNPVKIVEVK